MECLKAKLMRVPTTYVSKVDEYVKELLSWEGKVLADDDSVRYLFIISWGWNWNNLMLMGI